jgi:hypothetical protein
MPFEARRRMRADLWGVIERMTIDTMTERASPKTSSADDTGRKSEGHVPRTISRCVL